MTSLITSPVELRQQGFTALVAALGGGDELESLILAQNERWRHA